DDGLVLTAVTTKRLRGLRAGLVLAALCVATEAFGQETPTSTAPAGSFAESDPHLTRIHPALASEPALVIGDVARFYVVVTARQPTFADYLKGSDLGVNLVAP